MRPLRGRGWGVEGSAGQHTVQLCPAVLWSPAPRLQMAELGRACCRCPGVETLTPLSFHLLPPRS